MIRYSPKGMRVARADTWIRPYVIRQFKVVRVLWFVWLSTIVFIPRTFAQDELDYRLLTTLGRGTAESLAWRSDGAVLAIGGSAGVWFFDRDYTQIAYLETFPVSMVAWRPNGAKIPDQLAVALEDGGVELWDVNRRADSFSLMRTFAPTAPSGGIAWCKDGVRLATEAADGNAALIWNARTGEQLLRVETLVGTPVWSPDCKYIAGRRPDYVIGLWNAETGIMERFFTGVVEKLAFNDLAFNPDGRLLAAVSGLPASLHVWHVSSGRLLNEPDTNGDVSISFQVKWHPDGDRLLFISAYVNGPSISWIEIVSTETWESLESVDFLHDSRSVVWAPDGEKITALSYESVLQHYDFSTQNQVEHTLFYPPQAEAIWSPDGSRLVVPFARDMAAHVTVWKIQDAAAHYTANLDFRFPFVKSVFWLPDSLHIRIISDPFEPFTYRAALWRINPEADEAVEIERRDPNLPIARADWNQDFTLIAFQREYGSGIVEIFDAQRQPLSTVETRFPNVSQIAWSPDDRYIAVVSQDFKTNETAIEIFNSGTLERVRAFETQDLRWFFGWSADSARFLLSTYDAVAPSGALYALEVENAYPYFYEVAAPVESAAYSADMNTLAFAYGTSETGYTVQALDSLSAAPLADFTTQQRPVIRWHPHKPLLATAADDVLTLWNPRTDQTLTRILIRGVNRIAWSPDGTKLAAVGIDQRIRVFAFAA